MKKIKISLILSFFLAISSYGQLMKSFDNEKEWLLSWKIWDYAIEGNDYEKCANCMDSILTITNQPDKSILETGINCYIKTNQRQKAIELTKVQYDLGNITPCDDELISELLEIDCSKKEEVVSHPVFKEALINLVIVDQYYRGFGIINHLAKEGYEVHHDSLLSYQMHELDSLNQLRLKQLLAQHGFPTKAMVGKMGLISIHLVLQHADRDVELQKKYLPEMKALVEEGAIVGDGYAYLIDRILVNEDKPQIYGTQIVPAEFAHLIQYKEMENPEVVNQRRMKMGIMPYEKYLELMKRE